MTTQDRGMAQTSTPDESTSGDPSPSIVPHGTSGDRATWIAAALIIVLGLLAIGLVALTR